MGIGVVVGACCCLVLLLLTLVWSFLYAFCFRESCADRRERPPRVRLLVDYNLIRFR